MKRIFTLIGLIYCTAFSGLAQIDSTASILPDYVFKYSIGSILDPVLPAFQVATEYRIGQITTIQHELGFLFDLRNNFSGSPLGLRLRNEIRFYIIRPLKRYDTYIGIQIMGRYINARDQEITISRFNNAFFQQINTDIEYFDWGPLMTIGNCYYFKKVPMTLEIGLGFGIRYNHYDTINDLPEDAQVTYNGFFASLNPFTSMFFNEPTALGTRLFNLKIGYKINR